MFRGGDYTGILRAFRERSSEASNVGRVFAVRTHVDHGIRGVVVDVDHGREDLLYSERACFAGRYLTLATRVFGIAGRGHGHVPREVDGVVKTHARTRFEIGRDEQRILSHLLHAVDDNHGFVNWPTKKNDAAGLEAVTGMRFDDTINFPWNMA